MSIGAMTLEAFVAELAAKQPTPGGGAAAAVAAAVGESAAAMAAAYTQRKKDVESGAATKATALQQRLVASGALGFADKDAAAYADLQRSWKDADMTPEQKSAVEAAALAVPVELIELCHTQISAIEAFLPDCNPNITSDAKVGVHLLAGAARSAYQTALVNKPPDEVAAKLKTLLSEIGEIEQRLM